MKFLIVDDVHSFLLKALEQKGILYDYEPNIQKEEILDKIKDYEGIVIRSKIFIDKAFLQKSPKLQFILRAGSGIDNIDTKALENTHIHLLNAPEGNCDAVAEHCLGLLLSLFCKIPIASHQVKQKIWQREKNRGLEIKGKTIAIMGYGHTGRAFAKRLQGFGATVIAYDRKTLQSDAYAQIVDLEQIFALSDVVSLHINLEEDNKKIFNQSFIKNFHKPFFLLNTARGEIADLDAIVEGLETQKILGAGLDVLENEKLDTLTPAQNATFSRLVAFPNVILTPHVAGWTSESYQKISEVLATKLFKVLFAH